jgi:hypothetical protein
MPSCLGGEGAGPFISGSGRGPVWRAFVILCAWMAGFVAVAFWWFQRRDIQE